MLFPIIALSLSLSLWPAEAPARKTAPGASAASKVGPARGPKVPAYRCEGFIPPLRDGMDVERGRTLPLKASLLDEKGTRLDAKRLAAPPAVELVFQPGTPQQSDVTDEIEAGDFGSGTRFVFRESYWKFDLPTEDLSRKGGYRASLVSGDGRRYRVDPVCALRFTVR